jgi:hypothetical protein
LRKAERPVGFLFNQEPLMSHHTRTQCARLIDYMATGRRITPLDAVRIAGTLKLSTRIGELRRDRHPIKDEWVSKGGKRSKAYWLAGRRKH